MHRPPGPATSDTQSTSCRPRAGLIRRWIFASAAVVALGLLGEMSIMAIMSSLEGVISPQMQTLMDALLVGLVIVPTAGAIVIVQYRRGLDECDPRTGDGLASWMHGVIAALTVMTVITLCTWLAHSVSNRTERETLDEELLLVARLAAVQIDPVAHAALTDPAQQNGEAYRVVVAPLRQMLAAAPAVRYIYTVRDSPEGPRFVIDAADPVDTDGDGVIDQSDLGEIYTEADDTMKQALADGEAAVTPAPYSDQWGTFISAYAPVYHADGTLECIVGVDTTAEKYLSRVARMHWAALLALLVGAVASVGVGLVVWPMQWRRRAAEQALVAATADSRRLATAIDAHADAVFLTNSEGVIERINPAFESMSGYSSAEAVGQLPSLLKSGRMPPEAYTELWTTIKSGAPWHGRLCNRRKGPPSGAGPLDPAGNLEQPGAGLFYWVYATVTPILHADGSIEGFVAVHHDVTAEVHAEEQEHLRQEGIEVRLKVAKALAGIGTFSDRLNVALDAILAMRGLDEHKKGGIYLLNERDRCLDLFIERKLRGDLPLDEETEALPERGLYEQAARSGEVIVRDDCEVNHVDENGHLALKRFGQYVVPLMDRGSHGPAECVGMVSLFAQPHPVATVARLSALKEIGELLATAVLKERVTRLMELARTRAESASKVKSEFLANMSHEIRTPLTAILGYADLLRDEGDLAMEPALRLQTIDTIRAAGQHLLTVINDILDLSKIEADQMMVERIETPLIEILREVESLMRPRAIAKGVELRAVMKSPLPDRFLSDPTRLRQILLNLVGNAVKFTMVGGVTMNVQTCHAEEQERLIVDVEDTGPGMTEDQTANLFRAFSQADTTVTRLHGGTGLGLTISRRLAAMMGGDVKLMRTEPGKGSCFRLVLPLEPAPGAVMVATLEAVGESLATAPVAPMVRLTGRVLLAEDGADNQRLIAFHLKKAGADVTIADNGLMALWMIDAAVAQGAPYDLLLTDMQMPEMDGYTLARTLRRRGSTLAIIALTAHAMAEDRQRCLDAGCDEYASKPIDKGELLATCAAWMGRASTRAVGANAA